MRFFTLPPLVCYEVPDVYLGTRLIYAPIDGAITLTKMTAFQVRGYLYEHDSDALLDFMSSHWAWFVDV